MMISLVFFVLMSFLASVRGGEGEVFKRALPHYDLDAYQFQGHNSIDDYSHFAHSLPAYSTVSYVMTSGHYKPVSYSGFTNHGRGHHDPGYAVQFRSDGFHPEKHHEHHYY